MDCSQQQWPQLSYPVTLLFQHLAKDLQAHALFRSAQSGLCFRREGRVSLAAQRPMIKQACRKSGCIRSDRDKSSQLSQSTSFLCFSLKSKRASVQPSQQGAEGCLEVGSDNIPRGQASSTSSPPTFHSQGRRPDWALHIFTFGSLPGSCRER